MKSQTPLPSVLLLAVLSFFAGQKADGGSATWSLNPGSSDWNTATNWTPATVPDSPDDIATFATSNTTTVSLSAQTDVDSIVFASGASAFSIEPPSTYLALKVKGAGVINDSGITQNFVVGETGFLYFFGAATAGSDTIYTLTGNFGSSALGFYRSSSAGESTIINVTDYLVFSNFATAGNATIIIQGATSTHTGEGLTEFYGNSTAGNATFTINGGTADSANGGYLTFIGAGGGNSTMTMNGGTAPNALGGLLQFLDRTDAENATLIANGGTNGGLAGTILFSGNSRGGKARAEVFDTGELDMSYRPPGTMLVVGSIEGNGILFLGGNELSVGSNNLGTTFSGSIKDGGFQGGQGGSLSKRGSSKLTLTGANTYTGGTTVSHGGLLVRNSSGSGTGTGPVNVNMGLLGGTGTIAGAVTVGTGAGQGALLVPGNRKTLGTLTIQSLLTLNADAIYDFALNSSRLASDEVIAQGVTINGAALLYVDNGAVTLPPGTSFTVMSNTSATPIGGTFSNLPDGSTITMGSNNFQVNYEGGDGNDLTLTVVP